MIVWALACAPPAPPVVRSDPLGVEVAGEGVTRVSVVDPAGVTRATGRAAAPVDALRVPVLLDVPGVWRVDVSTRGGSQALSVVVPDPPPALVVVVEAPAGQPAAPLEDGDDVVVGWGGGPEAPVRVLATAARAGELVLRVGDDVVTRRVGPGERVVLAGDVGAGGVIEVSLADQRIRGSVEVVAPSDEVGVGAVHLPADPLGHPDLSRPGDRITLPDPLWARWVGGLGFGARGRDTYAPWGHVAVRLDNPGARDAHAAVRLRVVDGAGAPAAPFLPRMREGSPAGGVVSALARVPAGGSATVVLPLFVDDAALPSGVSVFTRVIEVVPVGSVSPTVVDRSPLPVRRGSTTLTVAFGAAVVSGLVGLAFIAARLRAWLRRPTVELMTIALLSGVSGVVTTAAQVVLAPFAAVLGPFSSLVTGLVDDTLRYALLAALIALVPKPGTAALALLVSFVASGLLFGSVAPTDLLAVGGRVLVTEALLWASGAIRGPWLTPPPRAAKPITGASGFAADRAPLPLSALPAVASDLPTSSEDPPSPLVGAGPDWVRASAARRWWVLAPPLAVAHLIGSGLGLAVQAVAWRLFLADWYVAMVLVGPGFLYVLLAVALAQPLVGTVRGMQR